MQIQIPCPRKEQILCCKIKKTTQSQPKSSLKRISSKCQSFLLTTYVLRLVDVFFNIQSANIWIQTVPIFSSICSSFRRRKTKRSQPGSLISRSAIQIMSSDTAKSASFLGIHLDIDSDGRLRSKLYDKRDDFNFPIVNFTWIYIQQHSSNTCMWSIYLSVDPIFLSLWFLSGFP